MVSRYMKICQDCQVQGKEYYTDVCQHGPAGWGPQDVFILFYQHRISFRMVKTAVDEAKRKYEKWFGATPVVVPPWKTF